MLIIPAIDIIDGACVRLTKGVYDSKKIYAKNPIQQAVDFVNQGANMIHIVDLDGAKQGQSKNNNIIIQIREHIDIPMQVGGGIRTISEAEYYLEQGINRIILGTKAITNPDFIKVLIDKFGSKRIVIGVDIKNRKIATSGWLKTSDQNYLVFVKNLKKLGVTELVVTDIDKDGTLTEPNYELVFEINNLGFNVIASGGISSVLALKKLLKFNAFGAIIGKALYEDKITIKDALIATTKNTLTKRIIPCLDVKNGRTVKGVNFTNLCDAGDPVELGKFYAESGADELVFLDITATFEKRKTVTELVKRVAKEIFIPFTVGGGIKTIDDIKELLQCGADKISINTVAVKNPSIIQEGAARFGSQCIVVAIDVKKVGDDYKVFIKGGKEETNLEVVSWAKKVERLGAGEILLTSMDRDGTKDGYDIELLQKITEAVNIPVIASGGAGSKENLCEALFVGQADAVLAASIFHFRKYTIAEVKQFLLSNNLPIRI